MTTQPRTKWRRETITLLGNVQSNPTVNSSWSRQHTVVPHTVPSTRKTRTPILTHFWCTDMMNPIIPLSLCQSIRYKLLQKWFCTSQTHSLRLHITFLCRDSLDLIPILSTSFRLRLCRYYRRPSSLLFTSHVCGIYYSRTFFSSSYYYYSFWGCTYLYLILSVGVCLFFFVCRSAILLLILLVFFMQLNNFLRRINKAHLSIYYLSFCKTRCW